MSHLLHTPTDLGNLSFKIIPDLPPKIVNGFPLEDSKTHTMNIPERHGMVVVASPLLLTALVSRLLLNFTYFNGLWQFVILFKTWVCEAKITQQNLACLPSFFSNGQHGKF